MTNKPLRSVNLAIITRKNFQRRASGSRPMAAYGSLGPGGRDESVAARRPHGLRLPGSPAPPRPALLPPWAWNAAAGRHAERRAERSHRAN